VEVVVAETVEAVAVLVERGLPLDWLLLLVLF
jgi:hypothetical protein